VVVQRLRSYVVFALVLALVASGCAEEPAVRSGVSQRGGPVRLYLAGDGQLAIVDVEAESARVVEMGELAAGDPPYRIVRRGRSLVFYGKEATYAIGLDVRGPPKRIHESWFFIPSAAEDRVWVGLLDPASPETVRALRAVAEVTIDGVVTVGPTRPPEGRWPVAAVSAGLLFERRAGGLELWDPATGRVVHRIERVSTGPTHGNLLAWCDTNQHLHITNVADLAEVAAVRPPAGTGGFSCVTGAFAPDGRMLALPVVGSSDPAGPQRLAVIELPSGNGRVVKGSKVPGGWVLVAWASSGNEVFLTGGSTRQSRVIVAYRLGEDRARRLAVEVPAFYGIAAS
jgi:hypothetical protein